MKIFKVYADEKPKCCILCPLALFKNKECGEFEEKIENGFKTGGKVPDERCLFEIVTKGDSE